MNQLLGLDVPENKSEGVRLVNYLYVDGYSLVPKELHGELLQFLNFLRL